MTFNLKTIRDEIIALLLAHPELDEDEILRADMIEGSTSAHEFVSILLRKIGATQALTEGTRAYVAELRERVERLERREQALRQLIRKVLEAANLPRMDRPEATVSMKAGVPRTLITSEVDLPIEFWRIRRDPDLTKIKVALKDGVHVPGAVLSNPEMVLSIRVK